MTFDNEWNWRKKLTPGELEEKMRREAAIELWLSGDLPGDFFKAWVALTYPPAEKWQRYMIGVIDIGAFVGDVDDMIDQVVRRLSREHAVLEVS